MGNIICSNEETINQEFLTPEEVLQENITVLNSESQCEFEAERISNSSNVSLSIPRINTVSPISSNLRLMPSTQNETFQINSETEELNKFLEEMKLKKDFLVEDELLRHQASDKFIPRWCELSNSEFKYFKNKLSKICGEKPLKRISVESIGKVIERTDIAENTLEIELKQTSQKSSFTSKLSPNNSSNTSLSSLNRMVPAFNPKFKKQETKNTWANRQKNMVYSENHLIFKAPDSKVFQKWQASLNLILNNE